LKCEEFETKTQVFAFKFIAWKFLEIYRNVIKYYFFDTKGVQFGTKDSRWIAPGIHNAAKYNGKWLCIFFVL